MMTRSPLDGHSHGVAQKRRGRLLILIGTILLVAIVVAQLIYPRDRALPLTRINNQSVAWQKHDAIVAQLQTYFESSAVKLTVGDKTVTKRLSSLGALPDTTAMSAQLANYPLWQRLIPFSFLVHQANITALAVYFDSDRLNNQADQLAKDLSRPPVNARLTIKAGQVEATEPKIGYQVQARALADSLSNREFALTDVTPVTIAASVVSPSRTSQDIAPVRQQATAALARQITVQLPDGRQFVPDAVTKASWMVVTQQDSGVLTLTVDTAAILAYVETVNTQVKVAPGITTVQLVDGRETSRTEGTSGSALNVADLVKRLSGIATTGDTVAVPASIVPVAPTVTTQAQYTSTQAGLQAYLDELARTKDVHIAIAQLDGQGLAASTRADDSIMSASTYKLYVSYKLFDQIDHGRLNWTDAMLDTDVSGCFERMIVVSDNACAEKFIAMFGRASVDTLLYDHGISRATTFEATTGIRTSAADLTKFLIGLQNGTLISGNNRTMLLDKMSRQVYRQGIPAGSRGPVQDKVGFLWDYIHDAAIVHHPRGTYVLTVMTQYQSYSTIAAITRQLERIMYP
jgi:beta-lactamase class A